MKCKSRYFLGETPTITISITNTSRSTETLKEAEYQKFSFEAHGIFGNDAGRYKKTAVYDGSWYIANATEAPGQTHEWLVPTKRELKFVKLAPGEATNLDLDLTKVFTSQLGVGKYQLTVKSEDGQNVVKEFEVYFDDEKSTAFLARILADNNDERNLALYYLQKFNRPKLVNLLEDLAKSGNENQRDFANHALAQIREGWFDSLKLRVAMKERYVVGEKPILGITILNGSSHVESVTKAEYQKFSFDLTRVAAKPETVTCAYDGSTKPAAIPTGRGNQSPTIVKLAELESTTLSLDLTECLKSKLDVGKYQLTVKSVDAQGASKYQTVVKTFEVYSR